MEKKQFFSGGGGGFSSSQQQFQGGYAYAYNLGLQISEEVNYGDKQMPQLVEIIDLEDDSDSEIVISKGPLGLKLRKSDSFVNLINKILNTDEEKTTYVDEMTNHGQFQAKDSEHAKKYLKPLNFNAKKLKIGTWKNLQNPTAMTYDLIQGAVKCHWRTCKILIEKIAPLNSAIDDVSAQLHGDDAPNGVAVNSDEVGASM
ncbi:hypothetical protein CFP56_026436 [Quercus suber]|uniref:Uncharacterized protein n=1 Tax=Quercus suber TaxID=58331 RepID=A0AAW0LXH0_QUESU